MLAPARKENAFLPLNAMVQSQLSIKLKTQQGR